MHDNLSPTRNTATIQADNSLIIDIVKTQITGKETEQTEKNSVIALLTSQPITKSNGTSANNNGSIGNYHKDANTSNNNKSYYALLEKASELQINHNKSKNFVIVGDSMMNNINSYRLNQKS